MLLPTKGISQQRALLTVGATIISLLDSPTTVSGLWERFLQKNKAADSKSQISFDWFALALTVLFTIQVVRWNNAEQLERQYVSA